MNVTDTTNVIPDHLKRSAPADSRTARTDFLELLVAQMRHQDPLQPQEGTEFMQQLATLTQVEQSAAMSSQLGTLIEAQLANARTDMLSMVGRTATATTDTVDGPLPSDARLFAKVPASASDVVAEIRDANGSVVRTVKLDATAGEQTIDLHQPPLPSGSYTVHVKATVSGQPDTTLTTAITGRVTKLENGAQLTLTLGGTTVRPENVLSVEA